MTARSHARCESCQQPFTGHGWIDRHTITDTEANEHDLDPGDYHDDCCPLCSTPDEDAP